MFVRYNTRKKDGKEHRYWSVVENRRLRLGHTTQRTVLIPRNARSFIWARSMTHSKRPGAKAWTWSMKLIN